MAMVVVGLAVDAKYGMRITASWNIFFMVFTKDFIAFGYNKMYINKQS